VNLLSAMITAAGMGLATSASAAPFFFTTGNPDGLLGALARSSAHPAPGTAARSKTAV
jgi:hypothetical protein